MKRNNVSSKIMRRSRVLQDSAGNSRYARKVNRGNQMYGGRGKDSCCAHRLDNNAGISIPRRGPSTNILDTVELRL